MITEADNLKDFNQISDSHLKSAEKLFNLWEKRTAIYLKHAFSNNDISEEFSSYSGPILYKSALFQRRCDKLVDDIEEHINKLKMIIENEDIKEELSSSKFKIPTKIKWKYLVRIIVAIIVAFSAITVALINKSDISQDSTELKNVNQNEVNVIINSEPNSSAL